MTLWEEKLRNTAKIVSLKQIIKTKLAVVEVRINNLEELLLCKSNMLEKQQYFLQYQDDSSLLRDQKTELGEVAESFQIIKALKKDLDLH